MKDLPIHSSQATSKCLALSTSSSCKTNCGAGRAGLLLSSRDGGLGLESGWAGGQLTPSTRRASHHLSVRSGVTYPSGRGVRTCWLSQAASPDLAAGHTFLPSPSPGLGRGHEVRQPSLFRGHRLVRDRHSPRMAWYGDRWNRLLKAHCVQA